MARKRKQESILDEDGTTKSFRNPLLSGGRGSGSYVPASVAAGGRIDNPPYNNPTENPGTPGEPEIPVDPENPPPATPVATSITLTPLNAGINVSGTVQLTAAVLDQFGNDMGLTASWTTSNAAVATVNSSGLVTGVSAGSATITAYYGSVVSLTATSVQVANPAITSVSVTPTSLSMTVGGATQTLTAVTRDAQGNAWTNRTVTWTNGAAGVASNSPASGYTTVVTAVSAGTPDIKATCETVDSNTVTGTVSVAGTNPNEPAGLSQVVDTSWPSGMTGSNPASGGTAAGWTRYQGGNTGTQVTDSTAPYKQNNILRTHKQSGTQGGGGEHLYIQLDSGGNKTRLYMRFGVYIPTDYVSPTGGVQKLFHIWIPTDNNATGNSCCVPAVFFTGGGGSNTDNARFELRMQNCSTVNGGSISFNLTGGGQMVRGTWYDLEVEIQLNTGGSANGIARSWMNGVARINSSNITYSGSSRTKKFTVIQLNPTYGGTGAVPSPNPRVFFAGPYVSTGT